jgi:hypothetical protein
MKQVTPPAKEITPNKNFTISNEVINFMPKQIAKIPVITRIREYTIFVAI